MGYNYLSYRELCIGSQVDTLTYRWAGPCSPPVGNGSNRLVRLEKNLRS
jgi:hypothetical protein